MYSFLYDKKLFFKADLSRELGIPGGPDLTFKFYFF